MQQLGLALLAAGAAILIGYWAYYVLSALFEDAPPLILAAVVFLLVGLALLFAKVLRDRIAESKSERFEEGNQ